MLPVSQFFCVFSTYFFFFFFFSSRRRHTRSLRDWSSDVCSSDLTSPGHHHWIVARDEIVGPDAACRPLARVQPWSRSPVRSEERRVGKECRSRWSADHVKKKREE